jgi:hypothetical protein
MAARRHRSTGASTDPRTVLQLAPLCGARHARYTLRQQAPLAHSAPSEAPSTLSQPSWAFSTRGRQARRGAAQGVPHADADGVVAAGHHAHVHPHAVLREPRARHLGHTRAHPGARAVAGTSQQQNSREPEAYTYTGIICLCWNACYFDVEARSSNLNSMPSNWPEPGCSYGAPRGFFDKHP